MVLENATSPAPQPNRGAVKELLQDILENNSAIAPERKEAYTEFAADVVLFAAKTGHLPVDFEERRRSFLSATPNSEGDS